MLLVLRVSLVRYGSGVPHPTPQPSNSSTIMTRSDLVCRQELVHAAARRNDMEALGSHMEELEDDRDLRAALLLSAKAAIEFEKEALVDLIVAVSKPPTNADGAATKSADQMVAATKVRKISSLPRSWANFSLL